MQEYRQEMQKMMQESEQLERYLGSLREDNRMTQNQLETVKQDVNSLQRNVKLQARMLEDNAKAPKVRVPILLCNSLQTFQGLIDSLTRSL